MKTSTKKEKESKQVQEKKCVEKMTQNDQQPKTLKTHQKQQKTQQKRKLSELLKSVGDCV
jgi:hypothetical protein